MIAGGGADKFPPVTTLETNPLPLEIGHLGNFEARMLRNFRAEVDDWDEVCSALGAWESQHLASSDSGLAKEHHRAWVSELLSWVRLRQLEDKLALWHHDMTGGRRGAHRAGSFSVNHS